jgi:hypothetical protein
MNEGNTGGGYIQYKNFDESEWRIIYSPEIESKFGKVKGIVNVQKMIDTEFQTYLQECNVPESKQPKYLLPLDKWFAFIIYPSIAVKVIAERDEEGIADLIIDRGIKSKLKDIKALSSAGYEKYSKPFGIDLAACGNF